MNDKIIAIFAITLLVAWVVWIDSASAQDLANIAIGAIAGMATGQVFKRKADRQAAGDEK